MRPLFAETSDVAIGAGITTIMTAVIGAVGTYFANKQAARNKADERDNDDKWKIIDRLEKEQKETKAELTATRLELAVSQTEKARMEERVGYLEQWIEDNGGRVPRKRPPGDGTSSTHKSLTDLPRPEGGVK